MSTVWLSSQEGLTRFCFCFDLYKFAKRLGRGLHSPRPSLSPVLSRHAMGCCCIGVWWRGGLRRAGEMLTRPAGREFFGSFEQDVVYGLHSWLLLLLPLLLLPLLLPPVLLLFLLVLGPGAAVAVVASASAAAATGCCCCCCHYCAPPFCSMPAHALPFEAFSWCCCLRPVVPTPSVNSTGGVFWDVFWGGLFF